MKTIRKSDERGHFDHGWLKTYHTFSFGDYRDARHMGFRALRVINDDVVDPGAGFGAHGHRDMEIVTYLLAGALEHRDSMGNRQVMRPGDVQRISAGSGILHSEYNASRAEPVHLLQIWILPAELGAAPSYDERHFSAEEKRGALRLIASPEGTNGALRIGQDTTIHATLLAAGEQVTHALAPGRGAWIHVAQGKVDVNGESLETGDALAVENEAAISILGAAAMSDVLVFDLA